MSLLAFLAAPYFVPRLSFYFSISSSLIRVPSLVSDNSRASLVLVYVYCAPECCLIVREAVAWECSVIATNDCTVEDLDAGIKDIGFSLKFSARYPSLAICVSLLLQNREIFARASFPKNYTADNRSAIEKHLLARTIEEKIGRSYNRLRLHMHISQARLYVWNLQTGRRARCMCENACAA